MPELFAILGGMIMAFIVALPLSILITRGTGATPGIAATVVAPIVEEPTKVLGVVFLAMMFPAAVATKTRGMILGMMGGLGFGFLESVFYVLQGANVFVRIMIIFFHMIWSGIVGIGIAFVASREFDRSSIKVALEGFISNALTMGFLIFLVTGMIFHGMSNAAASYVAGDLAIAVVILIGLIAFIALYWFHRNMPDDLKPLRSNDILGYAIRGRPPAPVAVAGARFCPDCGARVSPTASFCTSCGRKLR